MDLDRRTAELFHDMPPTRLDAIEWCTMQVGEMERQMAELVAWAPHETDPDQLECQQLGHTVLEWSRAKLLQRRNELLVLPGGHD